MCKDVHMLIPIARRTPVFLHPSSALFNRAPEWCVYHELVLTT